MTSTKLTLDSYIYLSLIPVLAVLLVLGLVSSIGLTTNEAAAVTSLHRLGFSRVKLTGHTMEPNCPLVATNRSGFAALTSDSDLVVGTVCTSTFIGHDTVVVYRPEVLHAP